MKITRRDKRGYYELDTEKLGNKINVALKEKYLEIYKRKDVKKFDKEKAKPLIISGLVIFAIISLVVLINKMSFHIETLPEIVGISALVICLIVFMTNANLEDMKRLVKWIEIKILPKSLKRCTKEFSVIEAPISDIDADSYVAVVYKGEKIYIHKNKFVSPIIEGEKYIAIGKKENYIVKSCYEIKEKENAKIYNDLSEKDINALEHKLDQVHKKLNKRKRQVILRNTLKITYIILALTIIVNAALMDNIELLYVPQVIVNTNAVFLFLVIIFSPIIALICTKDKREKELRTEVEILNIILNKPKLGSRIKGEVIALTTISDKTHENVLITIEDKSKKTYEVATRDIFDKDIRFGQKVCLYHIRGNDKYIITK